MIRKLTPTQAHRQRELACLICPCALRDFATFSRTTSRPIRADIVQAPRSDRRRISPSTSSSERPGNSDDASFPAYRDRRNPGKPPSTSRPYLQTAALAGEDLQQRLPRYLRRELRSSNSIPTTTRTNHTSETASSHRGVIKESAYRSRHYDPSQDKESKSDIRLLEPHVLSARLKKLCDASQIDAAVLMLKNAPLDAQNAPVWNTLIWESMKAKRFKLAYQLFVDMKRRGFSPTTRTFQTIFVGLSRIEHWSSHPKQLINARSVYDSFQRHMTAVKQDDPNSPELSINPLAAYIKILGDAGCYQEIFDVYYAMDSEGSLAPNQFIFTAMFQALSAKPDVSGGHNSTLYIKNAADAKLLWSQMQKASQKSPGFQVDSFIVTSALTALSRGRPTDHAFAFQIVRDYFGLTVPGDPPATGTLPLVAQSFAAVLKLCNNSQKYALCDHFLQQMKQRSEALGGVSILDRAHLEDVLKARLSLPAAGSAFYSLKILEWMLRQEITGQNGPKIRPAITTFNLVLTACWRDGDWKSAARTFDLMTGYHSHDFMDGAIQNVPRLDKRAAGRNLIPTPETVSSMVRAAIASQDRSNMRQCLRIIDHLDINRLFTERTEKTGDSNKAAKGRTFYVSKLASAVTDIVACVLNNGGKEISSQDEDEVRRWRKLVEQAQEVQRTPKSEFIPTLDAEVTRKESVNWTQYGRNIRR